MDFYKLDLIAEDEKVAGTKHYADACRRFTDAALLAQEVGALEDEIGIRLQRDPGNVHDSNAIKVHGKWIGDDGGRKSAHIGFLSRDAARTICESYDEDEKLYSQLASLEDDPERGFTINVNVYVKGY